MKFGTPCNEGIRAAWGPQNMVTVRSQEVDRTQTWRALCGGFQEQCDPPTVGASAHPDSLP